MMNSVFNSKYPGLARGHWNRNDASPAMHDINSRFKLLVAWRWLFLLLTLFCLQPAFAADEVRLVRGGQSLGALAKRQSLDPLPQNVVLLLHGMNSTAGIWNAVVTQYFANCPSIYDGKINAEARPNAQNTYCYRVNFGSFDAASPDKGLEDAWNYGESNGYASAGDYSTFGQLGAEVNQAINAIKNKLPNAQVLLLGHSRGGIAARAFLQGTDAPENKNSVVGLITTGTPHNGSRLGRLYEYIKTSLLNVDGTRITSTTSARNDWHVVDFLNGMEGFAGFQLDVRRPVMGYLADGSAQIIELNQYTSALPPIRYGAIAYTRGALGDLSPFYGLFDDVSIFFDPLSTSAEIYIKDATADGKPKPSRAYIGDGMVTIQSQKALPHAVIKSYKPFFIVRHAEEPKQTANIADMICRLNFDWISRCAPAAAKASAVKQASAPFAAVSDDYGALAALKTEQLWQGWLALIADDAQANPREHYAVALGITLRDSDDAAFYADIEQRVLNANTPQLERARLARLLAEIATPPALEILTDALLNPGCLAIQTALSNAILTVADSLPEQPRRADLSAVLEGAWTLPKYNQQQLNTLALALASTGTPSGVELLLAAVEKMGTALPSAKETQLNDEERRTMAAFVAMDEIINPDSAELLGHAFMSHRATEAAFIAAGNGLANLGRDDAAQRVLQRLDELPDNAVPAGQHWLNRLSGKISKIALQGMNKAIGMPRQRVLRQQLEDMVQ